MTGAELIRLRLSAGMTQVEFANELGANQPTLSRWEAERFPVPEGYAKLARWIVNPQGPRPEAPQPSRGKRLGPRTPKPCLKPSPVPPPPPTVAPQPAATLTAKPE